VNRVSERIERWQTVWKAVTFERIVALYCADAEHTSRLVPQLTRNRPDTLAAVRRSASTCRADLLWFVTVRIEVISLIESAERSAVEYRRRSNLDPTPAHLVELIDWRGSQICASIVFQF